MRSLRVREICTATAISRLKKGLIPFALISLAGCTSSADHVTARSASAVAPAQSQAAAGGCAGTQVSATTAPPAWAQAGFSAWAGIPWAAGKPPNVVAYLFATQLVAGGNRPDHRSNKVLWVTRELPEGLRIQGHPLGRSEPEIVIAGQITNGNQLPSIVDVPTPGCWSFDISWGERPKHMSTINLDVLPAGTLPARPTPQESPKPAGFRGDSPISVARPWRS